MDDLTAFLAARLDEDEARARRGSPDAWLLGSRALREVEAKRAILGEIKAVRKLTERTGGKPDPYRYWILRHLAAVYSDHPDYRPEWKP